MHIVRASEAHAMPRRTAFANESTVMALIDGLTRAGLDYHDYDVARVADMIDEAYESARLTQEDGEDGSQYLLNDDETVREYLDELAFRDSAPMLCDMPITFDLPRLSSRHTASADPSTVAGVTELITQAGLNPYHYFLDEIAVRVRDAIADSAATAEDGGDGISEIAADEFFEWVYEADKGPYGPNLYERNPGDGMSPVWSRS